MFAQTAKERAAIDSSIYRQQYDTLAEKITEAYAEGLETVSIDISSFHYPVITSITSYLYDEDIVFRVNWHYNPQCPLSLVVMFTESSAADPRSP